MYAGDYKEIRHHLNKMSHACVAFANNSYSEEQPLNGTIPERKRLSVCMCVCVTLATVANCHQSEQ